MSDSELVHERILQIYEALQRIERRFAKIDSASAFLDSDEGQDMLDAIGMMLIAIGENLKKVDAQTQGELLRRYPEVDWRGAKGVRDIISHHYFDLDEAEIFDICERDLPGLGNAIRQMLEELA